MASTPTVTTSEEERAQAFIAMGFTSTQAFLLAATQSHGGHIELDRVQRMLDAGCERELVLRIVL